MTDSKGFDTYDDEINSGNRLVLVLFAVMVVFLASMVYVSAIETKGGVYNGGFEYGTGSTSTTATYIGNSNYQWNFRTTGAGTTASANYDTTEKYSGNQSMKFGQYAGIGSTYIRSSALDSGFNSTTQSKLIPIKPSTNYKFSYWYKTNVNSAVTGFNGLIYLSSSDYSVQTLTSGDYILTTQDWTYREYFFTSGSTKVYADIEFVISNADMNVWVDDVRLEEVDTVSLSTQAIYSGRPSLTITGVTDTNAIDQSQTTYNTSVSLGNTTALYRAQQFLPTQNKLTGITFQKSSIIGTYTGNTTISIRPDNAGVPSTTILASKTYSSDEWVALTDKVDTFVNLPAIIDANGTNKYWVVFYSDANNDSGYTKIVAMNTNGYTDGLHAYSINGTSWNNLTQDLYFKTHFAKHSSSVDLNVVAPDGTSELKSFDVNGDILTDANITINPDGTGRYYWTPNFKSATNYNPTKYWNDMYDYNVNQTTEPPSFYSISGLPIGKTTTSGNSVFYDVTFKFTTPTGCTLNGLQFNSQGLIEDGTRIVNLSYSNNDSDYVLWGYLGAGTEVFNTNALDGNTTFYIRFDGNTSRNYLIDPIVDANLSCPTLTTPLFKNGTNTIYTMNKDANQQNGATLTPSLMSDIDFSFTARTTFSSFQVPNTTDQNITLTCTDNNTGCKTINYNVNNEGWELVWNEDIYGFEPSFETITKWNYAENDGENRFTGGQSEDWATNGTYSYKLYYAHSTSATHLGKYGQVSQKIDFTNINDLNLDYKIVGTGTNVANKLTCRIYIGSTLILNTNCGSNVENNLYYDTSSITGEQDFNIQLYTHDQYGTTTGSVAFYVDNITINNSTINQGDSIEDLSNYSFLYSGAGQHSISYFSTDNSDNNESIKTSYFTTYGKGRFYFKDENTGSDLTGVQVNFNGTDYDSGANNYLDFNFQTLSSTNTTYLFTLSKTGYSTRYYQTDLNYFSTFDINFALIPDTLDTDIQFKMFPPTGTTTLANTYIEFKDKDTNYTITRLKSNSEGELTANLRSDDQNYLVWISEGTYIYQAVQLTIFYPKDEQTLADITGNWRIEITDNISYQDLNIPQGTNKIIYLLPNTKYPFTIAVQDTAGTYFKRKWSKIYQGNPLTDTLQPYLVNADDGIAVKFVFQDPKRDSIENIIINIYKNVGGVKTLISSGASDVTGNALFFLIAGDKYWLDFTYNGAVIFETQNYSVTSSTVYWTINLTTREIKTIDGKFITVGFNPIQDYILKNATNISYKVTASGLNRTRAEFYIIQDGNKIITYTRDAPCTTPCTVTIPIEDLNITLGNKVYLDLNVYIDSNNYIFNYKKTWSYGTTSNIDTHDLFVKARTDFGCTTDTMWPCPLTSIVSIIIMILLIGSMVFTFNFVNPKGLLVAGLGILAVFTYVGWFWWVALVLIIIASIFYLRGD